LVKSAQLALDQKGEGSWLEVEQRGRYDCWVHHILTSGWWCSSAFQILLHDAGPVLNERRDHFDQAVGQEIADPDEPATFTFLGQDMHRSAMVLERLVQHGIYDTLSRIIYTDYSLADDKSIGESYCAHITV